MTYGTLSERLGGGSYFEIFSVQIDDRALALKRPKPQLERDPSVARMLEKEAEVLAVLEDDKHFPKFHGKGEENGIPHLLMERLDGINLDQAIRLAKGTSIDPSLSAGIALEIALGLDFLHTRSLFGSRPAAHGDIKPHNLMLLRDGRVVIIDLCLEGGTFAYMPPERMDSKKVDPATDIFALGLILYELLTGETLVPGEKKMEVYFRMKDLRHHPISFPTSIPRPLARIIEKALTADIEGGYTDAKTLSGDLSDFLGPEAVEQGTIRRSEWVQSLGEKTIHERNP